MSLCGSTWERELVAKAYEGLGSRQLPYVVDVDASELMEAYARCEAITRFHSRTFYLASGLLPPQKRQAVRALYAFCRVSDDIVARPGEPGAARRTAWRARALASHPPTDDPVALAWADTRARYQIPVQYAEQLIDGVARDLRITRYATFEDLAAYAYGVASTVGLMAMHIVGFAGEAAIPFAVRLGVALQLTNILRDVGEDWDAGRLYLPLEELEAFSLGEEDIAAGRVDGRWRAFMRYQAERTHQLYEDALPGVKLLHRDGRFAIAAAAELYRGIIDDAAAHDWDVFHRRAHLSGWQKIRRLPGIWWRAFVAPSKRTCLATR